MACENAASRDVTGSWAAITLHRAECLGYLCHRGGEAPQKCDQQGLCATVPAGAQGEGPELPQSEHSPSCSSKGTEELLAMGILEHIW